MHFRCDSCSRFFQTSAALQLHLASSIHSPRPYCETCIEWFPTQTHFDQHLATHHRPSTPQTFVNQHLATHQRPSTPQTLYNQHPATHHRPPTPQTYNCEQCSLTFGTSSELEEHTQSSLFHRYTAGRYYCDDCVLWFADHDSLNRHLTDAEEHASHFACVECGREFNGRRELEAHVLMGVLCRYGVGEEDTTNEDDSLLDFGDAASETYTWATSQTNPAVLPSLGSSYYGYTYSSNNGIDTTHSHEHTRLPGTTMRAESSQQGYRNFGAATVATSLPKPQPQTYQCLGQTCHKKFASPSALLQHLDSGACPSGINRHIVNSATISLDHSSAITNRRLRAAAGRNIHELTAEELDDDDEDEAGIATKYRAERSNRGPFPMGRPQLPWRLRNMRLDQLPDLCCPLCPRNSGPFRTATALHAHMTSQVHDAKIYHCSTTTTASGSGNHASGGMHASRNFSSLGALAQHLENRGCAMKVPAGARIFNETLRNVKERLRQVELQNAEGGGVRLQGLEWD